MAYTTINKPTDHVISDGYTGTSGNINVNIGFQPDLIWIKNKNNGYNHVLVDSVRGNTKVLEPSTSDAEGTCTEGVTAINSTGYTIGANTSSGGFEDDFNGTYNSPSYASWNWKGGTTSGITTNGSTDTTPSSYSFNQTSGISIVKYSGNGSTPTKIAHGLGAAPKMIMVKRLTGAADWVVGHQSMAWTKYIYLSSDGTSITAGGAAWENTEPDTVNFTVGDNTQVNASGSDYIAYCFAEKTGYSKFRAYTHNGGSGDTGTFVNLGFKPSFLMIKNTSASSTDWIMYDSTRSTINSVDDCLFPNEASAESVNYNMTFLSNGFKLNGSGPAMGSSGNVVIYAAFGQSLVGSNDVPCTGF